MIKIMRLNKATRDDIFPAGEQAVNISDKVSEIIANVRTNGDKALFFYAEKFDKAVISSLEVTSKEIDEAWESVSDEYKAILEESAENIRSFHKHQIRNGFVVSEKEGVVLGQKVTPLARVGVYVPGGTASYPSTVLMNCIPASLAGVGSLAVATPPMPNGKVKAEILVAARIAGVDKIYKCGGAGAVAAFAYGTESISPVDKIVGPGNAFVAEAKRQVFGKVAIDMIAGPSEILVIADNTCNASYVAADMLSQAEHDKMAQAVLVTDDEDLAGRVSDELERQITLLERSEIARASIDNGGKIIIVPDIPTAIDISNEIAPEHLEVCVDNPFDYFDRIKNAGSVFMGKYCPEALGDYFAGPNHTLPTSGTAKFSSPLSVDDFVKRSSFTYYTEAALEKVSDKIACFARSEGLGAHAASAEIRFKK